MTEQRPRLRDGQVSVTCEDSDGEVETAVIEDDYVLITAGRMRLDGIQKYGNGTVILTIKRDTA